MSTEAERKISDIKDQAQLLEYERIKAYEVRLQEVVAEISKWKLPPEQLPTVIAEWAFKLGAEFGKNKMYEYL